MTPSPRRNRLAAAAAGTAGIAALLAAALLLRPAGHEAAHSEEDAVVLARVDDAVGLAEDEDPCKGLPFLKIVKVLTNNLGGQGPDLKAPKELRYLTEDMADPSRREIDVVMTALNDYHKAPQSNGINGFYGIFNVMPGHSLKVQVKLVDHETQEPVVQKDLAFTFFDMDTGTGGKAVEFINVAGFHEQVLTETTEVDVEKEKDDSTTFRASAVGTGSDNPTDPLRLTQQQKDRAITLLFKDSDGFNFTVGSTEGSFARFFTWVARPSLMCAVTVQKAPSKEEAAKKALEAKKKAEEEAGKKDKEEEEEIAPKFGAGDEVFFPTTGDSWLAGDVEKVYGKPNAFVYDIEDGGKDGKVTKGVPEGNLVDKEHGPMWNAGDEVEYRVDAKGGHKAAQAGSSSLSGSAGPDDEGKIWSPGTVEKVFGPPGKWNYEIRAQKEGDKGAGAKEPVFAEAVPEKDLRDKEMAWWVYLLIALLGCLLCLICLVLCCRPKKEEERDTYAPMMEPEEEAEEEDRPDCVRCVLETADGSSKTYWLQYQPLGVDYASGVPLLIAGSGFNSYLVGELGAQPGDTITRIGKQNLSDDDSQARKMEIVKQEISVLPQWGLPLDFDTGRLDGQLQRVIAYFNPLGMKITNAAPYNVTKVEPARGADRIGVQLGWVLKRVGNESVENKSYTETTDLMRQGLGKLPKDKEYSLEMERTNA